MDISNPAIIAIIVVGGAFLLAFLVWFINYLTKRSKIKKTGVDEEKGVRYSAEEDITKENGEDVNVSFVREDIIIAQNTSEIAGAKNKVKSGKYTILSTVEGMDSFYVRIGAYVRGVKHGSQIVLAEGEKITPVSCSIILR